MQYYEMLCVLPGTLTEEETARGGEQIKNVIKKQGGLEIVSEDMGKSRLAYPMKHIRYGYFKLFYFQAEPQAIKNLRDKVKMSMELLRVLVQETKPNAATSSKKFHFNVEGEQEIETVPEEVRQFVGAPQKVEDQAPIAREIKEIKEVKKEVTIEDIDKKLEELLQSDLGSV